MELVGKKANFLGDSITEGFGTSAEDKIYLNVLKESASLACVRNYGIGGSRIAAQKEIKEYYDDKEFCNRVETMDEDADIVVVFGGTNDYGHGDVPLGTFEDRTQWSFYGAYHLMIQRLIKRFPDAQLVVMTPTHRIDEKMTELNNGEKNHLSLRNYVDAIIEVAGYYSIPVLDLFRVGGIQPCIQEYRDRYCHPDGLHISDAGHALIARKLENFLKTL